MNLAEKSQTNGTETQNQLQKQQQVKLQKLVLDLNKEGLKLLTLGSYSQAIQYFKKAQKVLSAQVGPQQTNCRLIQLSGITYNNLACYYKKTKKPKVALKYLKKALQLQVYKLNNWTSIAGTHLNICAIYSYTKSHQQAANHAQLAINFLQKVNYQQSDRSDQAKAYWNVYMLSYYNLAIQKEYLKQIEDAIKCYQKSKQIAKISGKRNVGVLISCDESISRLEPKLQSLRKKMIQSIQKKEESDQKGFAEYIFYNKKNYSMKKQNDGQNSSTQNQEKAANYLNKIALYKDVSTCTGNRFRTRNILSNSTRDGLATSTKKRVQSLTSFDDSKLSPKNLTNNQRNIRLLTQQDAQERSRIGEVQSKQIKQNKFIRRY